MIKLKVVLLIVFLFQSSLGWSEEKSSSVDIQQKLDVMLPPIHKRSERQRVLLGGLMSASGVAYMTLGLFSSATSGPKKTPSVIGYISAGGALVLGSIAVFMIPTIYEELPDQYYNLSATRVGDVNQKSAFGLNALRKMKSRAFSERLWGSIGLILGGGANLALGFSQGADRDDQAVTLGGGMAVLSLGQMLRERRPDAGVALFGMGFGNVIAYLSNDSGPSTDFLKITGGTYLALGLARLIIPTQLESDSRDFLKSVNNVALVPMPDGMMVGYRFSY